MRFALYARVSTRQQTTDIQLQALRRYAEAREAGRVLEYVDEGVSGAQSQRPALSLLIADAKKRVFDAVVVTKLDRLARSVRHLTTLAAALDALGIDLVVLDQGLDTSTPAGRLLFNVLGSIAEFERDLIRERVSEGVEAARKRGKKLGRPSVVDRRLRERIQRLADNGRKQREIAELPAARLGELMRRVSQRTAIEVQRVDSWSTSEIETLLRIAHDEENRFYPALLTLLSTGMRRGELLGLKWEDIDFDRGQVNVRRAIVLDRLTTPKSGKGRAIAMPAPLASALIDVLGERRRQAMERGWREVPEWVFCSGTGGPMDVRNFERSWLRLRRKAQKRGVRPLKLHCTRHTYASRALAAGKSVRGSPSNSGTATPS